MYSYENTATAEPKENIDSIQRLSEPHPIREKSGIGYSMGDVRVHYNSPRSAQPQAYSHTQVRVAPTVQRMKNDSNAVVQKKPVPSNLDSLGYRQEDLVKIKPAYEYAFRVISEKINAARLWYNNERYAADIVAGYRDIWKSIIDNFQTQENINAIIRKLFGVASPDSNYVFQEALDEMKALAEKQRVVYSNLLFGVSVPIESTLNDIFYWSCIQREKTEKIELTDSDMHIKGLGVCIVTFEDGSMKVIKPDERSFEKIVYGKKDNNENSSLASYFNGIDVSQNGLDNDANIGEMEIKTSKSHGSMIEYLNHNRFPDMNQAQQNQINDDVLLNTIVFSSLLGLADLHFENFVYDSNGMPQLLDAEVGLKYQLDKEELFKSAVKYGDMSGSIPLIVNSNFKKYQNAKYLNHLKVFLSIVKRKLYGQRCRVVVFSTADLHSWRKCVYEGIKDPKVFDESVYKNQIAEYVTQNGYEAEADNTINDAFEMMISDFKKGIIPYFERDFNTGIIYQKFSDGTEIPIVYSDKLTLNYFIDENIRRLDAAIFHLMKLDEKLLSDTTYF